MLGVRRLLGAASCRTVGTRGRLLVADPFLPVGLGMETSVQMGDPAACILTYADKRLHSVPQAPNCVSRNAFRTFSFFHVFGQDSGVNVNLTRGRARRMAPHLT